MRLWIIRYGTCLLLVAAALCAACSLLATVGGAGAGAAVGGAVGGPGGAIAGGAVGAGAGQLWGENAELRDGAIVGAGAIERMSPQAAPQRMARSERVAWGALGIVVLWMLRKPLWRFLKGIFRAPGSFLRRKPQPVA